MDRELLERLRREGEITPSAYEQLTRPQVSRPLLSQVFYVLGGILFLFGLSFLTEAVLRRFPYPWVFMAGGLALALGLAWGGRRLRAKGLSAPAFLSWMGSYLSTWIVARSAVYLVGGRLLVSSGMAYGGMHSLTPLGQVVMLVLVVGLGVLYVRFPILAGAELMVAYWLLNRILYFALFGNRAFADMGHGGEILAMAVGGAAVGLGVYADGRWRKDQAFWLELTGSVMASLGLAFWSNLKGLGGLGFFALQIIWLVGGFRFFRSAWVATAGVGCYVYLLHWVSVRFPTHHAIAGMVTTAAGIVVIAVGIVVRKKLLVNMARPERGSVWW
ncbi:MAG: hypothetical protein M0Z53_01020 [Thermaerobacter sp.]|nr:hypothetical protein [Thermaerobacter sp.]